MCDDGEGQKNELRERNEEEEESKSEEGGRRERKKQIRNLQYEQKCERKWV